MESSNPLRLVHFADLHLGVETGGRINPATGRNQRIDDACDRLDELCAVVEAEAVHAVLFAGDAFKNQHPNPTIQNLFASRVRRLARSGAAVFLLVGNHDLPKMPGLVHPFAIYDSLEIADVAVGDRAQVYRLKLRPDAPAPELQVAALPHFSRQHVLARLPDDAGDPDEYIDRRIAKTVAGLGSSINPALPSVFAGHCHVNQAELGASQTLFGVSEIEVSLSTLTSGAPFPYFALGHIHKRQVLNDDPFVAYPGSLERIDFGEGERTSVDPDGNVNRHEGEPKGFYRVDLVRRGDTWQLAGEPEFRTVSARSFVTLELGPLDTADPVADVGRRISSAREAGVRLDGALVRIKASIGAADRTRLTLAAVRDLIPDAYDVGLALQTDDAPSVRDPRFAEAMTETLALERYLESRDDIGDERDEILRLGRELIAEVVDR